MAEKTTLEALLEGVNTGTLSDETKQKLASLINETVDVRFKAKEKLLNEEVEALKTKLTTEAEETKTNLLKEAEENEKVLIEEAEKYKKELEETVLEETVKFKETLEKQKSDELSKMKAEMEAITLEEAKIYKDKQDAALVEEVKKFKGDLIDKVSDYMETKLTSAIPSETLNLAAKVNVLEPLVGAIMEGFSKNFIKLDTTSYTLIKEAKNKIAHLEATLQEKSKAEVKLEKEIREVRKDMKVKSLTEGMTQAQKEKAVKLLENVELDDMDAHFAKIRDIIVESTVKPAAPVAKPTAPTTPKAAEKIVESAQPVAKVEVAVKATTPIADKAVIDHQVKKVLSEGEVKEITTGKASNAEKVPEGANSEINKWASKVKPGYEKRA